MIIYLINCCAWISVILLLNILIVFVYMAYILLHSRLCSQHFWDDAELLFVWCFQMAQIILNIEMNVVYEPDLLNNRIILHVVDRALTITIINDQFQDAVMYLRKLLFGIFIRHICFEFWWAVYGLGGDDQQYRGLVPFLYFGFCIMTILCTL